MSLLLCEAQEMVVFCHSKLPSQKCDNILMTRGASEKLFERISSWFFFPSVSFLDESEGMESWHFLGLIMKKMDVLEGLKTCL